MPNHYNIVLKEKPLDDALCFEDVEFIFNHLEGGYGIPVEFEGVNSVAMGFIAQDAAEKMNYTYVGVGDFIREILSDMDKETPDGNYLYEGGEDVGTLLILIDR